MKCKFLDDSCPNTPNTPLAGVKLSPFAVQQAMGHLTTPSGASLMGPISVRHIQPPGSPGIRPKLPSMHSKLDFTKFNAAMYQKVNI